jgi:hypothetical protein
MRLGAVSIGSFEVSRWRDGRGDLPMGFQSGPRVLGWGLDRRDGAIRAWGTLLSMELESVKAMAEALRNGRARNQDARRLRVPEHNSAEGEGRVREQ